MTPHLFGLFRLVPAFSGIPLRAPYSYLILIAVLTVHLYLLALFLGLIRRMLSRKVLTFPGSFRRFLDFVRSCRLIFDGGFC